jgi:DNA helicase HerA-like ATPase
MGASGSGKSTAVKRILAAEPWPGLQIIVDPDAEYAGQGAQIASLARLVELAKLPGARSVVFVPSVDRAVGIKQFSFVCSLVWSVALQGRPVRLVVDELSEFTTASEAPAAWRRVVKRGRKQGISVIAAAQRPAEIDKTIWSNASTVRSGRLNFENDQTVIAAALGVTRDDVASLKQLDYLERDRNTGALIRGHLTF